MEESLNQQPESVLPSKTDAEEVPQDAPAPELSAFPNNRHGQLREISAVEAPDDLFRIANQLMYEARLRYWSARHSYHVVVGADCEPACQEYYLFCVTQEKANFDFVWEESKRLHEQMHFPFVVPGLEESVVDFNWCEYNGPAISILELKYQQYLHTRHELDVWLELETCRPLSHREHPYVTGNESKLIELYTTVRNELKQVHAELTTERRLRLKEHGKLRGKLCAIVKRCKS